MLHIKFRENRSTGSGEEDFLKVFFHISSPQRKKVVSANCSLFRRKKILFLSIPFLTATSKSSYKTS